MSSQYIFRDSEELYFVSYAVVGWIDLFIRTAYKNTLRESWRYCQRHKGLLLYGQCIMTSYVHMIIGSDNRCHFIGAFDSVTGTSRSPGITFGAR